MVHIPLMFLSEWREFPTAPCLARVENLIARISMLLKSRASPDMLPFSLCNKKRLAIRHMNRSKVAQTTGTVDVFDPRAGISGPTSRRVSHAQIVMNDGPNPLT